MAEFCSALAIAEIVPARHRARHHDSDVQLILFCPVLAGDAIQPLRSRHNFRGSLALLGRFIVLVTVPAMTPARLPSFTQSSFLTDDCPTIPIFSSKAPPLLSGHGHMPED
jgi:hypothetical protein